MRAIVARIVMVASPEADLSALDEELKPLMRRFGVEWGVVDSEMVDQPRSLREITEYESMKWKDPELSAVLRPGRRPPRR